MDATLADAVDAGVDANHVTMRKTQLGTLGAATGPALQILLLGSGVLSMGEADSHQGWSFSGLRSLVLGGWVFFPFIAPALCRFRDVPVLPETVSASGRELTPASTSE